MTGVNKIVYGEWTFLDDDIQSGNIYLSISLMSDALEANTFSATVVCSDKSILNFERNTPLTYFNRGKQIGIFYVQSITRIGPSAYTISATSAIGILIENIHYGGIYNGQTVEEVLPGICGTVPYEVKTSLREIALYGWLPVASSRDNLSQVLFAIGAVIRTDLDGVLHIEGLWDGISGSFGAGRMYQGPSVDYASKVTEVIITEHQYIEGGEEKKLFEGASQEGDIITFEDPVYNLHANGFSILESNANYAKLSAGSGTLTGTAYIHNTRQITEPVSAANEPNVKTVTEATLVSLVNSYSVAQRIANYYKSIQTINADAVYLGEVPGDLLSTWHPYDKETVSSCLENADISISNTIRANENLLVGFIPLTIEKTVIYDQTEILTGSGTWTPPEGTYSVRAVLIGGGGRGTDGSAGMASYQRSEGDTNTRRFNSINMTPNQPEQVSVSANGSRPGSSAGQGGEGGDGGVPGYVLEVDIEISDGQTFEYNCGTAGTQSGETGGTTTFGEYSSSTGGVLPNGYVDITTGVAYAVPGKSGIKGGNGGSGGQSGENVATATGGYGLNGTSDNNSSNESRQYLWYDIQTRPSGSYSASAAGGGGAGGGTEDNPGANGQNSALYGSGNISLSYERAQVDIRFPAGGSGGKGANGKNGNTYGSAGDGGSGGGGAGAMGPLSVSASITGTITRANISYNGTETFTAAATLPTWSVAGGSGGTGGNGVDGCILLYYGVEKTEQSGPFITKDDLYFIDSFGRRLVV